MYTLILYVKCGFFAEIVFGYVKMKKIEKVTQITTIIGLVICQKRVFRISIYPFFVSYNYTIFYIINWYRSNNMLNTWMFLNIFKNVKYLWKTKGKIIHRNKISYIF